MAKKQIKKESHKLVIAISSRALFNLDHSHQIFKVEGIQAYAKHQQENEGGSVAEEYRVRYVNDRVTTFGTAFLGLTLECCRCHDHKFDPLSQKDFYSLFAFFDDIDEAGL